MIFPVHTSAKIAEEFKPDRYLLQKLAFMSYDDAVVELEKLPSDERYEYINVLASLHFSYFDNKKTAMQFCDYAIDISEKHGFPKGRIYLLRAYIFGKNHERVETIIELENASKSFRNVNDPNSLKQCLSWLGSEYYSYGNFDKSQQAYEELLTLCTYDSDVMTKAQALFDVGEVYYRVSNLSKAKQVGEQAKDIFEKADNQKGLADCLKLLGNVYLAENENEKAKECYLQAAKAYESINGIHGQGNCFFNLGLMNISLKQYPDAEEYLKNAYRFYMAAGSITGKGISQMELGRVYCLQGFYEKAEAALKQAESFLTGQSQYRLAQTKEYWGDLEKARQNKEQSLTYYKASASLFKEVNLQKDEARVIRKMAEATQNK
jgi:tetratricopeptide (TPR) repeat protein